MDSQGIDMVTFIPLVFLIFLSVVLVFVLAIYRFQKNEMNSDPIANGTEKKETPNSN